VECGALTPLFAVVRPQAELFKTCDLPEKPAGQSHARYKVKNMKLNDLLAVGVLFSALSALVGWWIKSRLETSIKHEYDRLLEAFKAEQKRSEILHVERLAAFKELSVKLIALRRYCRAKSAEIRQESEFEPRTDSLAPSEKKSLLSHYEIISKVLDEKELFISMHSRERFRELFDQMGLGFNLELWVASGSSPEELSAHKLYDLVEERVNAILEVLYADLGFPSATEST
jgi:hypothetical protein